MRKIIAELEMNGYKALVYGAESGIQGVNIIQSGEKYAPQITDTFGAVTLAETEFTISTTSYGGLAVEEIKEVVAGYEKAVEAVEYFKEKLAIIEREDIRMKFKKFESVLLLDEILVFKGATDWLQAVSYKTASDNLDNYLEDSRADYNANYDAALDYYEYESDSLSDGIAERIFNIYLYIEFGQKAVI